MCRSTGEGGRRCEYADRLSTVRRKARRNYGENARRVEKAVTAWKRANSAIVEAHLPEQAPFAVTEKSPGRIPASAREQLTTYARTPITGGARDGELTRMMFEEHEAWMDALPVELRGAISQYTMSGYEVMNHHLRGNRAELRDMARRRRLNAASLTELREHATSLSERLDRALDIHAEMGGNDEGPRKLYRFMHLPAGVTPSTYLKKYLQPGAGYADPAYLSTTEDPDFLISHIDASLRRDSGLRYIAFELLTEQGASFQERGTTRVGNVQSFEHERVLPRGVRFRVAAVRERQQWQVSPGREDLIQHYHMFRYADLDQDPPRLVVPVVQLVDEELLRP